MDVTVAHLRSFVAVAEELHFGRAAQRLHLSASSVSEQVATLERRLAMALFTRTSRSVSLTAAGEQLLPLALRAVTAMDDVLRWARPDDHRPAVRLGLAVFSTQFRAIYGAAQRELPDIDVHVAQLGFADPLRALRDGEIDCALVPMLGPAPAGVSATPLWTDACVLIVADTHRLADRGAVGVADLGQETFVTVGDPATAGRWLGESLRDVATTAPVARNFDEILELCAAGVGVNVAGASGAEIYRRPGVRFIPITDLAVRPTFLCVNRGQVAPAVRRFVTLARRVARSLPDASSGSPG